MSSSTDEEIRTYGRVSIQGCVNRRGNNHAGYPDNPSQVLTSCSSLSTWFVHSRILPKAIQIVRLHSPFLPGCAYRVVVAVVTFYRPSGRTFHTSTLFFSSPPCLQVPLSRRCTPMDSRNHGTLQREQPQERDVNPLHVRGRGFSGDDINAL